jgi:hypothetical protein
MKPYWPAEEDEKDPKAKKANLKIQKINRKQKNDEMGMVKKDKRE